MQSSFCAVHRAHLSCDLLTDAERVKLGKILQRLPSEWLFSRWAAQWNSGKDSPPPPSTEKFPWPPSSREVKLRGELLAAQIILMADRGLSPAEISAAFMDQGLKRPIRPGLSKPLITPAVVEGTLASWRSSRELCLSVSQRLRYAASGIVFASPEELPSPEELQPVLQRRYAELVNRCCNEPGRVDSVPPREAAEESEARKPSEKSRNLPAYRRFRRPKGRSRIVPKAQVRPARGVPRGRLDEQAAIEVKKNPSLTYLQLAAMFHCNPSTLRDPKRYPLLAAAKKLVKAERDRFRGGDTWKHRLSTDDE
jgi:hypothetical protein